MHRSLLEVFACPKCKGDLIASASNDSADDIVEGELSCHACGAAYPITNGIVRFVPQDNYASSFGYQWNRFRKEQIDSFNGTALSAERLWTETGWNSDKLAGKWVLDAGCGAGRFLDAAAVTNAKLVGVDISSAIDAAKDNLADRQNVHFVQASLYELPFREGAFDYCYCIGVIQHTPDTAASVRAIAKMVKPNGSIAVTIYPRKPWTKLFSKYWVRPITKRLKKETLLRLIEGVMPFGFPVTDVLFRLPLVGRIFMFLIPIANYVHEDRLTRDQRYAWAVLDTFDMLSPYYDQPMTEAEAAAALEQSDIRVRRGAGPGVNLVGERG
jgi:2-polyprenyl-3-methyl-5-hydroxy-6-metoxy-1,4-benzoquinol methylase/uncharacterized protein YbaR (Trm112 family)